MADRGHVPARIGVADVVEVEEETRRLREVDYRQGGGACRDAAIVVAAWSGRLCAAAATDAVRRRLLVALADVHNLAAWACFDTGLDRAALRHWGQAERLAAEAGHEDLVANIHYRVGRLRLHRGAVGEALSCFGRGLVSARRAGSSHATAILRANQAWALACRGERAEALRRLGQAHEAFAATTATAVPGWARFFDETDLGAINGLVHTGLARTVDPAHAASAIPALTSAVAAYPEGMDRSRALSLIALTANHLVDNDFERAAETGERALALAGEVESTRVADQLRPVGRLAGRYRGDARARELAGRIAAFAPAA
ncbi:tetratricopeptide repeat protein [Actinosynnema sp. NPDC059797]